MEALINKHIPTKQSDLKQDLEKGKIFHLYSMLFKLVQFSIKQLSLCFVKWFFDSLKQSFPSPSTFLWCNMNKCCSLKFLITW